MTTLFSRFDIFSGVKGNRSKFGRVADASGSRNITERKRTMKEKMIMAGSYLIAGLLSCTVLIAAAKCADGECPMPVTAMSQDADAKACAKDAGQSASAPDAEKKRRRTRKAAAQKKDGDGTEAPRKRRARRTKKQMQDECTAASEK